VDEVRARCGFKTIKETIQLTERGNVVLDPWSTLVSRTAVVGSHNVFYPNVIIEGDEASRITIGSSNHFYPLTLIAGLVGGVVEIGDSNEFGEGGFTLKANRQDSHVVIGTNSRFVSGVQIFGRTTIGDGCQVLGQITVQDSRLEGGESYKARNPDDRGAVLKGYGLARGVEVLRGMVINGGGVFSTDKVEAQSSYH
jgi:bifunctional N-acetylglucosamine-1-phosphate-uridyltransferase/glucosamine-1-phosphate-acetyltransferase GlmU-like protein